MFFSEDKIIEFILELDVQAWNHCLNFKQGEWVLKDGLYYQAQEDIDSEDEKVPGVDTEWGDSEECAPRYDLTTAQGFIVLLYQTSDRPIEKYSKQPGTGFQSITEIDYTKGEFSVNLLSVKTKELNSKKVYADIKIRTNNSDFPDGFHTIMAGIEIQLAEDTGLKYLEVPIL